MKLIKLLKLKNYIIQLFNRQIKKEENLKLMKNLYKCTKQIQFINPLLLKLNKKEENLKLMKNFYKMLF